MYPAPAVEGLSCRSSASVASFFSKPRHAEVETWLVCKQAPGPRGFLYKGCFFQVIYFQVWSIRGILHPEIVGGFHCHQDGKKLALEIQSKHPPLVSDSRGWALNSPKKVQAGAVGSVPGGPSSPMGAAAGRAGQQRQHEGEQVHLRNSPIQGNVDITPEYLGVMDGVRQAGWCGDIRCRSPRNAPILHVGATGLEAGAGGGRARGHYEWRVLT